MPPVTGHHIQMGLYKARQKVSCQLWRSRSAPHPIFWGWPSPPSSPSPPLAGLELAPHKVCEPQTGSGAESGKLKCPPAVTVEAPPGPTAPGQAMSRLS